MSNAVKFLGRSRFGTLWLLGWLSLAAWLGFGHDWLKHTPAPAQAALQSRPVAPRQESRAANTQPKLEAVAISQMKVGDQIPADNPTGEQDTEFGDTVDPPSWRKLVLLANKKDGSTADVELLRPLWWLDEQHAEVGGAIEINVPECGIEGQAQVLAIGPCPTIKHDSRYRIVTGTFKHQASQVLDVYVEGLNDAIGTTPNHPFWSEDRQTFVRADNLKEGERLRAFNSTPIVRRIVPLADPEPVFNLEVQCDHVYHVAKNGVLVHNSGWNMPWWEYEARVLQFLGIPGGSRQVEFSTPWGSRIVDGVGPNASIYEVSKFNFAGTLDNLDDFTRLQNKLAQLEKDALLLANGEIRSLTVITAEALPTVGRGAAYTERILDLQRLYGASRVIMQVICPGAL